MAIESNEYKRGDGEENGDQWSLVELQNRIRNMKNDVQEDITALTKKDTDTHIEKKEVLCGISGFSPLEEIRFFINEYPTLGVIDILEHILSAKIPYISTETLYALLKLEKGNNILPLLMESTKIHLSSILLDLLENAPHLSEKKILFIINNVTYDDVLSEIAMTYPITEQIYKALITSHLSTNSVHKNFLSNPEISFDCVLKLLHYQEYTEIDKQALIKNFLKTRREFTTFELRKAMDAFVYVPIGSNILLEWVISIHEFPEYLRLLYLKEYIQKLNRNELLEKYPSLKNFEVFYDNLKLDGVLTFEERLHLSSMYMKIQSQH